MSTFPEACVCVGIREKGNHRRLDGANLLIEIDSALTCSDDLIDAHESAA